MLSFSDSRNLDFTAYQLYSLVLDVEKYPEFVPWCESCKVLSKEDQTIYAELSVRYGLFAKSYTSKIDHGVLSDEEYFVHIVQTQGPFEKLNTDWAFKKDGKFSSVVNYNMELALKSSFLENMLSTVLDSAADLMINAFEKRAQEIYGNS
ncbi:MAG: type II toxin-antitoxin system RatA family toxin [Rickettsiaceae bacterium]|nr:type II toxin-antitoxin system RatA family toxin [Rickettsiaceae bacterium]